jgi:hypothetical protein
MKQFEFKTVRYEPGLGKRITGDDFGEGFLKVLSENGRDGWDLKTIVREHGLQTLLIFSREAQGEAKN